MSSGAVALSTWAGDDALAAWIPQQPRVTVVTASCARSLRTACGSKYRFSLSFRDIRELMLERGIVVSHETIRLWCLKFTGEVAE